MRDLKMKLLYVVHNVIAHPLLPLAEALDLLGFRKQADVFFRFHDETIPEKDDRNHQRYL